MEFSNLREHWIAGGLGFICGAAAMALASLFFYMRVQFRTARDHRHLLASTEQRMQDSFANLSLNALREAKKDLIELAGQTLQGTKEQVTGELRLNEKAVENLVRPISEALERLGQHSIELERKRASAYDGMKQHIEHLLAETTRLSCALRRPTVRGSWGELTLRTVCENAGMVMGEHFDLQEVTETDDGVLRPDLIVNLPRGRRIIVDSKTPMDSFRDAMTASDEATREAKLKAHGKAVRDHMKKLSAKAYWSRYGDSPDCTVLFIPTESAYFAAMEVDADLVRDAAKARVLIANPMTLIGLLRAAAHVLDDERLIESTEEVRDIGRRLYESLRSCLSQVGKLGRHLRQSTDAFNEVIGVIDKSVMPKAKRLRELGSGSGDEIQCPEPCDLIVRTSVS